MSRLRDKLDFLYHKKESLPGTSEPNVRQRLEKLVEAKLKHRQPQNPELRERPERGERIPEPIHLQTRSFPLQRFFGPVRLAQWREIRPESWGTLFPDAGTAGLARPLFIDTETTGLSGGVGTLPFMIGSGYFDGDGFTVKVMTLLNPAHEQSFLQQWQRLIEEVRPDCLVSFNGKAFDLPLLESRFILNRLPFTLDEIPHLDFLHPARTLWGWSFRSRRLGILGEELLGISRQDDIPGECIPSLYFDFLRRQRLSMLEPVIRHNALDIVGLAALLILGAAYLQDPEMAQREGELLGLAQFLERRGDLIGAEQCLEREMTRCRDTGIRTEALKRMALCKKRRRLFDEAARLWSELLPSLDKRAFTELIVHTSYREGNMKRSMELIHEALEKLSLTPAQRRRLEERLSRLQNKMDEGEAKGEPVPV